ncbi:MAG TPA: FAD-binding oxidoreductase [Nitrososphaeraceae archaeon]|nr:FAD-binding oxidoreductase [Nitrososphaeraceae archaeon]
MASRQTAPLNPEIRSNNWELYTSGQNESSWFKDIGQPLKFDKLARNISVDVAIIGGGIAGVTTAYLLSKSGKSVALLEDGYIGSGETGRTTAHITHALDDRYYNIQKKHGVNSARIAAESHTSAINFIDTTVREERIDCGFRRLNGYLFLDPTDNKSSLDKEIAALKNAGIYSAKIESNSPLESKETSPCICFQDQAQFQPLLYLTAITNRMSQNNEVKIFTETHAQEIQNDNSSNLIKTNSGYSVTAQDVVIATNAPIIDKVSKIYDKQVAYRTYVIVAEIQKNTVPSALYWDTGNQNSKDHVNPYHYVRIQKTENEKNDLLIVGGEDHKTGSPNDRNDFDTKFKNLATWMRKIFFIDAPIVYTWSGQVMEPLDGLAFIGTNPGKDKNVYIATGDSGNGITHGTIAGIILNDLILGKNNPWAELYNPNRNIR